MVAKVRGAQHQSVGTGGRIESALAPARIADLEISGDGRSVFFTTTKADLDHDEWESERWSIPIQGGQASPLKQDGGGHKAAAIKADRTVTRALSHLGSVVRKWDWCGDHQSVLAVCFGPEKGELWHVPLKGPVSRIDLNGMSIDDATVAPDGTVVAVASDPNHAPELYRCGLDGQGVHRISDLNGPTRALGRSEIASWSSNPRYRTVLAGKIEMPKSDFTPGFHPNGVVTFPSDYDPSRRYPLLVIAEPSGSPRAWLDYNPFRNCLADLGYVVLDANCRGANNLGPRYLADADGDAGEGQAADLLGGIDLLFKRNIVDPKRVLIVGWSTYAKAPKWVSLMRSTRLPTEYACIAADRPSALRLIYEKIADDARATWNH